MGRWANEALNGTVREQRETPGTREARGIELRRVLAPLFGTKQGGCCFISVARRPFLLRSAGGKRFAGSVSQPTDRWRKIAPR